MKASFHNQLGAEDSALADALIADLEKAKRVRVVVAWMSPGRLLSALTDAADRGVPVEVIVGLCGFNTHPKALQDLVDHVPEGHVGIWDTEQKHLFHPKVYVFDRRGGTTAWVGSLNATKSGFSSNWETAVRVHPAPDSLVEEIDDFVAEAWERCTILKQPVVDRYRAQWKWGRKAAERQRQTGQRRLKDVAPLRKAAQTLLGSLSWKEYYARLLKRAARYRQEYGTRDILTNSRFSYLQTITDVRRLLFSKPLKRLTRLDAEMILGFELKGHDCSLLGCMSAAKIKGPFCENRRGYRDRVLAVCRERTLWRDDETSLRGVIRLQRIPQVGPAVATRLGSVLRPDLLVSLNQASESQLSQWSGIPVGRLMRNDGKGYVELMRFVWGSEWYRSTPPKQKGSNEYRCWEARCALLDAFLYLNKHDELDPEIEALLGPAE